MSGYNSHFIYEFQTWYWSLHSNIAVEMLNEKKKEEKKKKKHS